MQVASQLIETYEAQIDVKDKGKQSGAKESSPTETGAMKSSMADSGTAETGAAEAGGAETGSAKTGSSWVTFREEGDFVLDVKQRQAALTEKGLSKVHAALRKPPFQSKPPCMRTAIQLYKILFQPRSSLLVLPIDCSSSSVVAAAYAILGLCP